MSHKARWPSAVYFDASVLRKLPFDLSSPELVRLKELASELTIGLFVPEVAAKEWIAYHQGKAREFYEAIGVNAEKIRSQVPTDPLHRKVP